MSDKFHRALAQSFLDQHPKPKAEALWSFEPFADGHGVRVTVCMGHFELCGIYEIASKIKATRKIQHLFSFCVDLQFRLLCDIYTIAGRRMPTPGPYRLANIA